MNEETLTALANEIARQDAALAEARRLVEDCDDAEHPIPAALLEELEAATTPAFRTTCAMPLGLRA